MRNTNVYTKYIDILMKFNTRMQNPLFTEYTLHLWELCERKREEDRLRDRSEDRV